MAWSRPIEKSVIHTVRNRSIAMSACVRILCVHCVTPKEQYNDDEIRNEKNDEKWEGKRDTPTEKKKSHTMPRSLSSTRGMYVT